MRRRDDALDSFDLFLDTVCNTFGGIVFLAILLAIMVQNRSVTRSEEEIKEPASAQEIREALAALESLSLEHEQLSQALASLAPVKYPIEQAEFVQLEEQSQELQQQISSQMQQLEQRTQKLAEVVKTNEAINQENREIPSKLAAAEAQLQGDQQRLKDVADSKAKPMPISRARSSASGSLLLLVENDRLYYAKAPSLIGDGFNRQHVNISTDRDSGITVTSIAGAGWSLKSNEGMREFREILDEARKKSVNVTVAVWPESFEEFSGLAEEMVRQNVLYQLWPMPESTKLKIFIGKSGDSSVQ